MIESKQYVSDRYHDAGFKYWETDYMIYQNIKPFSPDGNVHDDIHNDRITEGAHFIMRMFTQYHLREALDAMKVDLSNPNVAEDMNVGNIGTAGRIAKVWCGYDMDDDTELGSGRWRKKPRLATFPNTHDRAFPITKRLSLTSTCSHHFLPFSTIFRNDSYVIISYIPDKKVLGISKLQRLVDWVSQRFFLQEDLTRMIYEEIVEAAETDSVFVKLFNVQHSCESTRGSQSCDGAFTSEYFGGQYTRPELRSAVVEGN